jgi:hypothetical protein
VALGGGETADRGVDGVDVDQGRLQHEGSVDHLGYGGRGGSGRAATLGVKRHRLDAAIGDEEGDPR